MKLLLLIISLWASASWAKTISLKEAVTKCNSYTPELRAKSSLCKKVDEKLAQLKLTNRKLTQRQKKKLKLKPNANN